MLSWNDENPSCSNMFQYSGFGSFRRILLFRYAKKKHVTNFRRNRPQKWKDRFEQNEPSWMFREISKRLVSGL